MLTPRGAALLFSSVTVLFACGAQPARSPVAAPTTSTSAATPADAGQQVAFGCRLPLGDGGKLGKGGFVHLPDGTFTADPQSLLTYDWAFSKWLPVPRTWVSPDGRLYAYPEYPPAGGQVAGIIHVVDVPTGADRVLHLPAPVAPISFEKEGLYVGRVIPNSDSAAQGLSLLDPASGSLQQVVAEGHWTLVAPPVAWGVDVDSSIAPPRGDVLGAGNRLRQLHLSDGTAVTALTLAGRSIQIIGLDGQGAPVLGITDGSTYRVAAFSAFAGLEDWFSGPVAEDNPTGPMAGAGSKAWLSSETNAIWEKTSGSPLRKVATAPLEHPGVGGACRQ